MTWNRQKQTAPLLRTTMYWAPKITLTQWRLEAIELDFLNEQFDRENSSICHFLVADCQQQVKHNTCWCYILNSKENVFLNTRNVLSSQWKISLFILTVRRSLRESQEMKRARTKSKNWIQLSCHSGIFPAFHSIFEFLGQCSFSPGCCSFREPRPPLFHVYIRQLCIKM